MVSFPSSLLFVFFRVQSLHAFVFIQKTFSAVFCVVVKREGRWEGRPRERCMHGLYIYIYIYIYHCKNKIVVLAKYLVTTVARLSFMTVLIQRI